MKKFLLPLLVLLLVTSCEKQTFVPADSKSEAVLDFRSEKGKVTICHYTGSEENPWKTIEVSESALDAHLAHGDVLGGCGQPTVTPGYSGLTEAAGVRYRGNSSGNEIYLGIPDLGVGANRVEASYPNVYANWQDGTYVVTFSFDPVENKIITTIDGPGGSESVEYDFDDLMDPGCPSSDWNTMDINVVDRLTTGELAFNNVMLDGFSLGDFDSEGWNNWTVSGFDFSQGFTLSGDLIVQGWTGSETNKLQIVVGCLP